MIRGKGSFSIPKVPPRETKIKKDEYMSYLTTSNVQPLNLSSTDIEMADKEVKCATLDKLIEYATLYDDKDFFHCFVLTHTTFCSVVELFDKLISRYFYSVQVLNMDWIKKELVPMRLRITLLVKSIIEKNFYLFQQNEDNYKKLFELIDIMKKTNGEGMSSTLEKTYLRMKSPSSPLPIKTTKEYPKTLVPRNKDDVLNWPTKEVARQLTLREMEMFQKIQPREIMNWTKEKKGTNIQSFINWFNALSNYLCFKILESRVVKDRAKIISLVIQIAGETAILKNYNTTFELLSVLNHSSIHRLKQTWELIPTKDKQMYDDLNMYISSDNNFKFLRDKTSKQALPILPYIGLYLTDMTFCDDGNPNLLNGKINFGKRMKMAAIIKEIQKFQGGIYELNLDPNAQGLLGKLEKRLTDEELYELSLAREKRE